MDLMGAWNASINGNDTAQDLKYEYQAAFFYNNVEIAIQKLDAYFYEEFAEDAWADYVYSLADYMWKHGILTEDIRNRAIGLIDSGFGLDIWAEEGAKSLNKRKLVLSQFRQMLLSPQPPKKKISVKLYLTPIFEPGDLIAFQLQTDGKVYLPNSSFSEDFFRSCNGKYVVVRKVTDTVSYTSRVEPNVKDIWPIFELYGKIFDDCPTAADLKGVPIANAAVLPCENAFGVKRSRYRGTFLCEGSLFYFRKRKFVHLGNNVRKLPRGYNNVSIFLGYNTARGNADSKLLEAIMAT